MVQDRKTLYDYQLEGYSENKCDLPCGMYKCHSMKYLTFFVIHLLDIGNVPFEKYRLIVELELEISFLLESVFFAINLQSFYSFPEGFKSILTDIFTKLILFFFKT